MRACIFFFHLIFGFLNPRMQSAFLSVDFYMKTQCSVFLNKIFIAKFYVARLDCASLE